MLETNFKTKFWIVVGIQIAVIFAVLLFFQLHLITGEQVLLKLTPPRDPLSLFQGHYLILNYEISEIEGGTYLGSGDFKPGEIVYVTLSERDGYYGAYSVSREKPKEGTFIRGKLRWKDYQGDLNMDYGIEEYFIPEKEAEELERKLRKMQRDRVEIYVRVVLNKSGRALIDEILVQEGELVPLDYEPLESKELPSDTRSATERDMERIQDIVSYVEAIENYHSERGVWPGEGDASGVHLSPKCFSDLRGDLIDAGEFNEIPADPLDDRTSCTNDSDGAFFYGWDSDHCCEGSYCISINNVETSWGIEQLRQGFGKLRFATDGSNANIEDSDFNHCFVENEDFSPSLNLISPQGGETLCLGDDFVIGWESTGIDVVRIGVRRGSGTIVIDSVAATQNETGEEGKGIYVWEVGKTRLSTLLEESTVYRISIEDAEGGGGLSDVSGIFSILRCEG